MAHQTRTEMVIAVYDSLARAEAALHALQAAGVAYPLIRMRAHLGDDERPPLGRLPEHYWSLSVVLDDSTRARAPGVLREHGALSVGHSREEGGAHIDADQGAIAWRHFVFESPATTDQVGEAAGTVGTTGVISSGAFAEGAQATDEPETAGDEPSPSDTMKPEVATDRSRPQTVVKPQDQ